MPGGEALSLSLLVKIRIAVEKAVIRFVPDL